MQPSARRSVEIEVTVRVIAFQECGDVADRSSLDHRASNQRSNLLPGRRNGEFFGPRFRDGDELVAALLGATDRTKASAGNELGEPPPLKRPSWSSTLCHPGAFRSRG